MNQPHSHDTRNSDRPNAAKSPAGWPLVSALTALSMTSYLARANVSVASESMRIDLGLSHVQMGEVFSSFLCGYALFQIGGGAIGDRFGPRLTLGVSALLWSLTSVLTAALPPLFAGRVAGVLITLGIVRFVLGVAEATTFPAGNLVVRTCLAQSQHGIGTAVMFLGTSIASAVTGPLVSHITVSLGWQSAFYLTAVPPLLLDVSWLAHAPPDQMQKQSNTSRPISHGPPGWLSHPVFPILAQRNVLLLVASYISEGYVLFLFVFWMYTYLVERRGFSLLDAGWLAAAPWLTALALTPIGGYICDRVSRRSGKESGSRVIIVLAILPAEHYCM